MRQIMRADMMSVLFGIAIAVVLTPAASADDALGPMSGTGGVMRDAERRALAPARLDAMARRWNLSDRARGRLDAALARWCGSDLRAEALGHDRVRAEVPFFAQADAPYGDHVEGAIDLLATDGGSDAALVVDYKTGDRGLSPEEIRAHHELQANFYAYVLMGQGYRCVECAFCCVELDTSDLGGQAGQPYVVRYHFDRGNPPVL